MACLALLAMLSAPEAQPAQAPAGRPQLPPGAEAWSLLGQPLTPAPIPDETRRRLEADLDAARRAYEATPGDVEAAIWYGRRLAYLGRYRDAIEVFTKAIAQHPRDARLYRHRGHRWITVRELPRAIADLEHAASLIEGQPDAIEPDGQPNARNLPTSTLHTNVHYHLGLARYLAGEFDRAREAYEDGVRASTTDDMRVAMTYWLNMTLRRLGRVSEADALVSTVRPDLELIENQSYHRLLMLWRRQQDPDKLLAGTSGVDFATLGYGIGMWHLLSGRDAEAQALFRKVVEAGPWQAFGAIAAEAELARTGTGR